MELQRSRVWVFRFNFFSCRQHSLLSLGSYNYEKEMLIEEPKYVRDFIYKRNARYSMKIVKDDDVQSFAFQFIKSAADEI